MNASTTLAPKLRDRVDRYRDWKRLARLLLLIALVWLIATQFDAAELRRAFVRLKPGYLVPIILLLTPLAVILRSLRWRYLLAGADHLPLSAYVGAYLIGFLSSSLLPAKLGELVKAKVICDSQIDYGRSLASVVIDRLVESLALLLVFAVVLLKSPLPSWAHRLAWAGGLASTGILVALRALLHQQERFLRVAGRGLRRFPAFLGGRLLSVLEQLLAGCEALADYRRILGALVCASAVWGVEIAAVVMFLTAFSIPAPRLVAALLILTVLNFGMLVPVSPGSVGVYQLLCALALSPWGVDRQLGFALGIVMQAVLFLPPCLGGLVWLLASKRNRTRTKRQAPSGAV